MKIESRNELAKAIDKWPKPFVPSVATVPASGLGDKVHNVLGPIGRDIGWPCLKGDGTTDLKPKSLCNYLRLTLNKI